MTDLFAYPHTPGSKARDTSRAAAVAIAPAAANLRDRVLALFEHSRGLTADEAASRLGLPITTIRPRCSELVADGKLRDSGERRANRVSAMGRNITAIVWAPVYPAAIAGQRVG